MRPKELPQAALAKWLDFADRVEVLEAAAREAEAEVTRLREIMSSKSNDVSAEEFGWARDNFQRIYTECQTKRSRANTQAKILSAVKAWIEKLPDNTCLIMVQMPVNSGAAAVRAELKEAREKLRVLRGTPPASPDIADRVDRYVRDLARGSLPAVRGYSQGQSLAVQWPNDAYDGGRNIGLLVAAALDREGVAGLIFRAIEQAQPLSQEEHAAGVAQLTQKIETMSYTLAALTERSGGEFDAELQPWCVLGVRVESEQAAA